MDDLFFLVLAFSFYCHQARSLVIEPCTVGRIAKKVATSLTSAIGSFFSFGGGEDAGGPEEGAPTIKPAVEVAAWAVDPLHVPCVRVMDDEGQQRDETWVTCFMIVSLRGGM